MSSLIDKFPGSTTSPLIKEIQLIPAGMIEAALNTSDLVENLLGHGGLSVAFGASNAGKSFVLLDLAAHVADNLSYHGGLAVEGGAVVYITLEGQRAFNNRIAALRAEGKLSKDAELFVVQVPFSLLESGDCDALLKAMEPLGLRAPPRLVIVDTLSRAMPGGDENSAVDMMAMVAASDRIRSETGAQVTLVHHIGKSIEKGARGHSCLKAAVDTEIEISRDPTSGLICVQVKKQRDFDIIPPLYFKLRTVCLGMNNRGKMVTSCVVEYQPDVTLNCGATRRKGARITPTNEQVLSLVPETGTIKKSILKGRIRDELYVTDRHAEEVIQAMYQSLLLNEVPVKSPAGQNQTHVVRVVAPSPKL
jgi:hypothetical protein